MAENTWATPEQVEALRKRQAEEYGVFTADGPIDIGGARAFNDGDPVPTSHVDSGAVRTDQVKRVATKAEAKAAAKEG
jgi:hypothetical protein